VSCKLAVCSYKVTCKAVCTVRGWLPETQGLLMEAFVDNLSADPGIARTAFSNHYLTKRRNRPKPFQHIPDITECVFGALGTGLQGLFRVVGGLKGRASAKNCVLLLFVSLTYNQIYLKPYTMHEVLFRNSYTEHIDYGLYSTNKDFREWTAEGADQAIVCEHRAAVVGHMESMGAGFSLLSVLSRPATP